MIIGNGELPFEVRPGYGDAHADDVIWTDYALHERANAIGLFLSETLLNGEQLRRLNKELALIAFELEQRAQETSATSEGMPERT
jgi:hypothetical protein